MTSLSWLSSKAAKLWNVCKSDARWWKILQRLSLSLSRLKLYDRTPEGGPSARIRVLPTKGFTIMCVFALEVGPLLPDHTSCTPCASRARPTYYR